MSANAKYKDVAVAGAAAVSARSGEAGRAGHSRRGGPLLPSSVRVVQRHVNAYNRRDFALLRALSDADIELDWTSAASLGAGVYRGIDAVLGFYADYLNTFEEIVIEPEGFALAGDSVSVPNTARMRGRDGIEVLARSTLAFTVREGRVSHIRLVKTSALAA